MYTYSDCRSQFSVDIDLPAFERDYVDTAILNLTSVTGHAELF